MADPAMTRFADLVAVSSAVGATSSRLGKVRELASFLRALPPGEIEIAVHYLSGEIVQGRIGIGYSTLQAAAHGIGATEATLSITEVDHDLSALRDVRGAGSGARRSQALTDLFGRATPAESQFLIALLVGELRQGALAGVMIDAIASAAQIAVPQVRRAAMYSHSLGQVASVALQQGADALGKFQLELFCPIAPMLAQTAADVAESLEELAGEAAFEWKMDGARIQVHKREHDVRIYTRALNEVTASLPEIVEAARSFAARELVLDGEAIAFNASQRPHPFQVTMRRFGRKLDIHRMRDELPIRAFYFDCLYLDGHSIADRPTRERFDALAAVVPQSQRVPRLVTSSESQARAFYEAALAAGHEGVMAKALDAPYEAGNRDARWLKIKRAHTLDLVVIAAEWGHGRRTGKLSNLHLGALDDASGEYVMLGKTFKGLTDAMLEWQTREFLQREIRRDQWTVYLRPELVVEIAFSDLQASRRYPGGLALRLARVKRYREDKSAEQADTMESVRSLFVAQSGELNGESLSDRDA
jgi:DNA ligase 1